MSEADLNAALKIFERLAGGDLPDWSRLKSAMSIFHLKQGDYLFHAKTEQPYLFLVANGLLKMIYETAEGDEWIKAFVYEDMFFASVSALATGRASFSVVAIEDARVVRIEYSSIEQLADANPAWQKLLTNGFKLYGARKEQRERSLLICNAEQRYQNFLADYPMLEQRLMQKDIAAYIRVTPIALSRIKKRLS
jgi:CRP-like cAMP-binding protein